MGLLSIALCVCGSIILNIFHIMANTEIFLYNIAEQKSKHNNANKVHMLFSVITYPIR